MENIEKMQAPITYSLQLQDGNSDFYADLEEFRVLLINSAKIKFFGSITTYQKYAEEKKLEKVRKWEEYLFELLMIGVYWKSYSQYITTHAKYYRHLFGWLFHIRTKYKALKRYVDKVRGYLGTILLAKRHKHVNEFNVKNLKHLLCWLDCTKEFTEEVKRLNNWVLFFGDNPFVFQIIKNTIDEFTNHFENMGKQVFGKYTSAVNGFIEKTHSNYRFKENYFFTRKREAEYHLNMLGASIMNHVLEKDFRNADNQIVLLPTCMCSGNPCKAREIGKGYACVHCTPTCNVSKIAKELDSNNTRVVLIPHSSKFSKFLKDWRNQSKTGVVGVGCVLNLIHGGYEMTRLNIPSQCVLLDYCGCKKHWNKGVATNLNTNQLKKVLRLQSSDVKLANV